jgi:hypothetical protein
VLHKRLLDRELQKKYYTENRGNVLENTGGSWRPHSARILFIGKLARMFGSATRFLPLALEVLR